MLQNMDLYVCDFELCDTGLKTVIWKWVVLRASGFLLYYRASNTLTLL